MNLWLWLLLAAGVVVYAPAFLLEFGFHNDYSFLTPNPYQPWAGFPETRSMLYIGRPVGALLLNLQMLTIHGLTALKVWRMISFLLASASATVLYKFFRHRLGLKDFWAAALAFGFLTAPPVQVYVLWATNVVPGTFNILFSLCVYLLLDAAAPDGLRSLFASRRRLLLGAVALLLLLLSFAIYPPTAQFALVLAVARVAFMGLRNWPASRRIALRDACVFAGVAVAYFILTRVVVVPIFEYLHMTVAPTRDVQRYEFGATLDPLRWVARFAELTRVVVAGPWAIFWGAKASWIVGPLLGLGLLATGLRARLGRRRASSGEAPQISQAMVLRMTGIVAALLAMVTLANISMLAARGATGFAAYRALPGYFAILVVLQVWMFWRWAQAGGRAAAVAAGVLMLASGLVAFINVTRVSQDLSVELLLLRQRLAAVDWSQVKTMLFINSREWHYPTRKPMINDFGLRVEWNIMPGMVRALHPQFALPSDKQSVGFIPFADTYYLTEEGVMVVDMDGGAGTQLATTWPPRVARVTAGLVSVNGPLQVDVKYSVPAAVAQYVLEFGLPMDPPSAKTPGWAVLGSYDGTTWKAIDAVPPEQPWDREQSRSFPLPEGTHYSKYRFEFTRSKDAELTLRALRLPSRIGPRVDDPEKPRLIIERYRGFDIYAAGEGFFALSSEEGSLNLKKAFAHEYKRFSAGFTVRELKWHIDDALGFVNQFSTVDYSDQDFLGVTR